MALRDAGALNSYKEHGGNNPQPARRPAFERLAANLMAAIKLAQCGDLTHPR